MTEADILGRVRDFITENFLYMRKNKDLGDEDSLLYSGLISSMAMIEVVEWIESTFTVSVDPSEVTVENFDTVRSLTRYIEGKL